VHVAHHVNLGSKFFPVVDITSPMPFFLN
jgi:hypothetical protein